MIRKDIKQSIKEYFFINPSAKLRVREIERTLKLPLPSVIRYCRELENEEILTTLKTGNVVFYTSSKSDIYILEKKLYNIKKLYSSGLVEYLKHELSNPIIIVFGSYSKGEDTENSDIDLYVETPSKKQPNLDNYKKIFKREIHIFQNKNIKQIANPHLANNILNGLIINGQIEVFT